MTRISTSAERRLGNLSGDKSKLFEILLEEKARIRPGVRDRSDGEEGEATSWAQQRLWFIDQLEGGSASYNMPFAVRLRGNLDEKALIEALNALIVRHEVLRASFATSRGEPKQRIADRGEFSLTVFDLGAHGRAERDAHVQHHQYEEAHGTFDLKRGPLIRGRLLRLVAEEHVLLVTMHHIISDGWSIGVFIREFGELYSAFHLGQENPLPPLEIQYADYVCWQRKRVTGKLLERQLSYWRAHLHGAPPQLDLPTDRRRPAVQTYRGGNVAVLLESKISAELRSFAQRHGMTLFMALSAAWAILLFRLSGQGDLVTGTPIASRQRPELEDLIGFFANTLALRFRVRGDMRVRELLEHVKEVTLGAYAHQDLPFEKVVEALQAQRSLSRNPLFQVAFVLQNAPKSEFRLPELTATLEEVVDEPAIFDLLLALEERGTEIAGSVNYAADLFDRETIHRWMAYFNVLVGEMMVDAHREIGDLPILPDSERQRIAGSFSGPHLVVPQPYMIHELFETQVRHRPNTIAVVHDGQALTYAELNSRSNQLARYLQNRGVGPDRFVCVCVEYGLEMVVALLAILKSGAAYVPLDRAYPSERLLYILADVKPQVLLIEEKFRGGFSDIPTEVISMDGDWQKIAQQYRSRLNVRAEGVCSVNAAYVIYTSGSTGEPKGVVVEHRNVTRLFSATEAWFHFDARDVWTVFHSFAFDFSVWELWGALLHGGRAVLVPRLTARSPVEFYRLICSEGVTVLNQTPGAFAQIAHIQEQGRGMQHSLRAVIFGGEALEPRMLRSWVKRNGVEQPQLVNMYGITETTVHVTFYRLGEGEISGEGASVIGRPIPDLGFHLLDERLRPVPIGVTGEIYVGGAGVARGYLNRQELTAQRFIADPYSGEPQARLYKTGDLARWLGDGTIEYLGRNDHQVKIRGYRIELGEVQAQIARHTLVKDVAVIAREDEPGERRLVAYVVPDRNAAGRSSASDSAEKLRREIVSGWSTVFKQTYEGGQQEKGPTFVGWDSCYTGRPIPEDQMQEWLECTVARIATLRPRRVLEIGCGVGLVLQHLAPHCETYVGTDFSESALNPLRRWLSQRKDLHHVQLLQRSATDLQDLSVGSFDTVVLNSVAQYFPDIDYLLAVLEGSVRLLAPGGKIFIGDVRHIGTLPMLQAAIQLGKAASTTSVKQLRQRIAKAVAEEKELLVDPQFFHALVGQLTGISASEVCLKRGWASNELTRHRYDVVLNVDVTTELVPLYEPIAWSAGVGSLESFEDAVKSLRWRAVRITSIPNSRLVTESASQRLIETCEPHCEAALLEKRLGERLSGAVDPETVCELAEAHGYDVKVTWSQAAPECFDLQLLDPARAGEVPQMMPKRGEPRKPWSAYATAPVEHTFGQELMVQLREHLKTRVPEYMIPSAWIPLKDLPITPNGKLDRSALPSPQTRRLDSGLYIAPRTENERVLANIWAELLGIDQVGIYDNFFELGGHSLLIVQMMERLRHVALKTQVRSVYACRNLSELAGTLTSETPSEFLVPPSSIPPGCGAITPQMLPLVDLDLPQIDRITTVIPGGAVNIQDIYPLAPLQEGILFHHLLNEQQGDAYTRSILLSFTSRNKLDKFIAALEHVIARHDILRTAVLWEQLSRPIQVVCRRVALPVEEFALEPAQAVIGQLNARLNDPHYRLELRRPPLIRLEIAADPRSEQWYLLLRTHHLVFDNESLPIMMSEVMASMDGRGGELPPAGAYRSYVAQALAHSRARDAERFFRTKLGDVDEPTTPFDLKDVHGDGSQTEETRLALNPGVARRLRVQARRMNVSAATIFHAAWALVVAHTSGQEDVVYGTVLLGRLHGSAGAQRMLGMLINTLPLRLRLHDITAENLVIQTQRELAELLEYEQTSLAEAQRYSGVARPAPLFSALLNYHHSSGDVEASFSSATGVRLLAGQGRTNYPIHLSIIDLGTEFQLEMETDRRIDPNRMLQFMATATQSLVDALDEAPQTAALCLPVVTHEELHRVVTLFNATSVSHPQTGFIHRHFEEQVGRRATAPAVVFESKAITYGELNARANQLARYLRDKGVGPDRLVGVCVERSLELVVGLLGILKAGGAYVPLDPDYPAERLEYMLSDAAPLVLLTQRHLKGRLPTNTTAQVLALDDEWGEIARHSSENLDANDVGLRDENLVYVIYTSGSTGRPKGAMNEHRALVNRLLWMQDQYQLSDLDRVLQKTPFSFDVSVWEFFWPLITGACLVMARPGGHGDPTYLVGLIEQTGTTTLHFVPSMLQLFLDQHRSGSCRSIRRVICSGEELPASLSRQFFERLPMSRLYNLYGPTEAAIDVTAWECAPTDDDRRVPIGRPISNIQMYVLDRGGRPVPIGVTGDLYIGGLGVGRGYWNRPDLTAEKFLPDPFAASWHARIYKTGDLGRWREDGAIEYFGRNDDQVKIRGFRIELGEIESRLLQHPLVREAIVIAPRDETGDRRLVAYLVAKATPGIEPPLDTESLRAYILEALPDYMVPSAFVVMERFPLTPNGKLDRRGLFTPPLDADRIRQLRAPEGELEEFLAGIWKTLLRVEQVGTEDNFFELGGHSLHAMRLILKVEERLKVRIPAFEVFRSPTIRQFVGLVARYRLINKKGDASQEINFVEGVV